MSMHGLLDSLLYSQDRQSKGITKNQQVDELINKTPMAKLFEKPDHRGNVNNYLLKKFGSPAIAAGIAGNIDVETGGSFDFTQKQKGGGGGEGLFQFSFKPMKRAYSQYLDKNGLKNSAEAQIDFVKSATESNKDYELGPTARRELQEAFATNNPTIISEAFMNHFEDPGKPHPERRFKSSQEHFKQFIGEQ